MTKKPIPRFETEAEERRFWQESDSTDYVDWSKAVILHELRPSPSQPLEPSAKADLEPS